ncbi:MAG: AMMECR1 domain-containing protein [Campylobacterales bacterium]|nr:AMMECR1 domain-containing protein [Campylobacterales bacterium]
MSRSVLLQLMRDSIHEVYEAKRTIDKPLLLDRYPLLNEKIATTVNVYLDNELRSSYSSTDAQKSLLEDIICNAKRAIFEDKNSTPLTTSEYLSCELELILNTPDGVMSEKDPAILKNDKRLKEVVK